MSVLPEQPLSTVTHTCNEYDHTTVRTHAHKDTSPLREQNPHAHPPNTPNVLGFLINHVVFDVLLSLAALQRAGSV